MTSIVFVQLKRVSNIFWVGVLKKFRVVGEGSEKLQGGAREAWQFSKNRSRLCSLKFVVNLGWIACRAVL